MLIFVYKKLACHLHSKDLRHQLIKRTTVFELQIMRANINGI